MSKERKSSKKGNGKNKGRNKQPPQTPLYTTDEAAAYLNIPVATLPTWRVRKSDRLPFVRIGRLIRYRRSDLDRFIASNIYRSTSSGPSSLDDTDLIDKANSPDMPDDAGLTDEIDSSDELDTLDS